MFDESISAHFLNRNWTHFNSWFTWFDRNDRLIRVYSVHVHCIAIWTHSVPMPFSVAWKSHQVTHTNTHNFFNTDAYLLLKKCQYRHIVRGVLKYSVTVHWLLLYVTVIIIIVAMWKMLRLKATVSEMVRGIVYHFLAFGSHVWNDDFDTWCFGAFSIVDWLFTICFIIPCYTIRATAEQGVAVVRVMLAESEHIFSFQSLRIFFFYFYGRRWQESEPSIKMHNHLFYFSFFVFISFSVFFLAIWVCLKVNSCFFLSRGWFRLYASSDRSSNTTRELTHIHTHARAFSHSARSLCYWLCSVYVCV